MNWRDDWAAGVLGLQALFHLIIDNNVSCRFDAILADSLTFCYIYQCNMDNLMFNFINSWPEIFYALTMLFTTFLSSRADENELDDDYNFYFSLGENAGIIIDNVINYRPAGSFTYDRIEY